MLVFPPEYTSKKLPPGYVWNMKTKTLFSFKGGKTGILYPLAKYLRIF